MLEIRRRCYHSKLVSEPHQSMHTYLSEVPLAFAQRVAHIPSQPELVACEVAVVMRSLYIAEPLGMRSLGGSRMHISPRLGVPVCLRK